MGRATKSKSGVRFGYPNQIHLASISRLARAVAKKATYEFVGGPDTRVLTSDEVDDAKDRAVNEILARRKQR